MEVATFLSEASAKGKLEVSDRQAEKMWLELLRRKSTSHTPPAREFVPRNVPFPSQQIVSHRLSAGRYYDLVET